MGEEEEGEMLLLEVVVRMSRVDIEGRRSASCL